MKRRRIFQTLAFALVLILVLFSAIACNNNVGTGKENNGKVTADVPKEEGGKSSNVIKTPKIGKDVINVLYQDDLIALGQLATEDNSLEAAWLGNYELEDPHYKGVIFYDEDSAKENEAIATLFVDKHEDAVAKEVMVDVTKGIYLIDMQDQTKRFKVATLKPETEGINLLAWSYSSPAFNFTRREELALTSDEITLYEDDQIRFTNATRVLTEQTPRSRWEINNLAETTIGFAFFNADIFKPDDHMRTALIGIRRSDGKLSAEHKLYNGGTFSLVEFDGDPNYYRMHGVHTNTDRLHLLLWARPKSND